MTAVATNAGLCVSAVLKAYKARICLYMTSSDDAWLLASEWSHSAQITTFMYVTGLIAFTLIALLAPSLLCGGICECSSDLSCYRNAAHLNVRSRHSRWSVSSNLYSHALTMPVSGLIKASLAAMSALNRWEQHCRDCITSLNASAASTKLYDRCPPCLHSLSLPLALAAWRGCVTSLWMLAVSYIFDSTV